MKTSFKNRKKQLLALCLSALLTSSVGAFAACTDDTSSDSSSSSSSSSSTSTTVNDTGLIKNDDFETFDTNDGKNLIGTSVTGWSRSVNSATSGSALSSKAASGIIDVSSDAWTYLTGSTLEDPASLSDEDAKKKWDTMSAKDKLLFLEAWEDRSENKDKEIDEELDFYQKFNIDSEDIPAASVNPGTHYSEDDDKKDSDTKVLMIHNEYESTKDGNKYKTGTAQKFTSSSTVTVKAGTSAYFSVWVKTTGLQSASSDGTTQDAVDKGAYISVNHSIGGKSLDALQVKNINTENMSDSELSNGWKQYTFYLRGASYADSTFTVVLGLGLGGGTDRLEYVNGYAFFDDLVCETIDNDTFVEETANATVLGFESTKEEKIFDASDVTANNLYALDFYGEFDTIEYIDTITNFETTTEKSTNGTKYTAASGVVGTSTYPGLGFSTENDVTKVFANAKEMESYDNAYLQKVYKNYFADDTFLNNDKILMLMSANGAAYTATSTHSFEIVNTDSEIETMPKYLAISFWVKTSELNGFTGAGITLNDDTNKTSIASIDTTTLSGVTIGENEDVYSGWQQCLFFVENTSETEVLDFTLSFTYGPTTVVGTTKSQYYAGFAAFAGFKSYEMDKAEFESAASGTYSKIVALKGSDTSASGDSGFDSTAGVPKNAIETGFANPRNYKGVYNDSAYIVTGNTDTSINQHNFAGLLNKEHAANYTEILSTLGGDWATVFGNDTTQPLVIYNTEAQEKAYGYIGSSKAIAANTYSTISLRVKTNTTAGIYLVDMDDDTHSKLLSIGRQVSYWYDDEGNVCDTDPADEHFNEKKDVAFKLQSNGLYKVNTAWKGYDASKMNPDTYYANLANYAVEAETNNLKIAEGGVSYNYNSYWNNDGQDGYAFYAYDAEHKTAYADSEKKVAVSDFSNVGLTPRYEALETEKGLYFEVANTNGEWATVTFYVHTGDTARNYRLEVWCGTRDGVKKGEAGSYVYVDTNKPADVTAETFTKLVEERKDDVTEDAWFENVFSFYDNAKFLRYDETIDENEVGNSYESYVSSAYSSGVAYLKYESAAYLKDENENAPIYYEAYADYGIAEVTVTADVEEDDTTEEETDDPDNNTNIWLLTSSIAIAAILVFVVISLAVRKIVANSRKRKTLSARVANETKKDKKSK